MKKKRTSWIKILIICTVILVVLICAILFIVGKIRNNIGNISENEVSAYFREFTVSRDDISLYVKGTGEITSFNIKDLEVYPYSTIKAKYKSDGDIVKAKERIMQISTEGYYQNISSPIDGMYFETEKNGIKVYEVYDLNDIGVDLAISENDVALLSLNQKATVKISALNRELDGTVSYISKLPTSGKFRVRINILYDEQIRFGYGVSVKILAKEQKDILAIPYEALFMDTNNRYYVIKKEHELEYYENTLLTVPDNIKTYVEVGTVTRDIVEIIDGLEEGDIVAVRNY